MSLGFGMEDNSGSLPFLLGLVTNLTAILSIYLEWDFPSGLFMFCALGQDFAPLQIVSLHIGWAG